MCRLAMWSLCEHVPAALLNKTDYYFLRLLLQLTNDIYIDVYKVLKVTTNIVIVIYYYVLLQALGHGY